MQGARFKRTNIGKRMSRGLSLLLLVAGAGAGAQLFLVLSTPQRWLPVSEPWMASFAAQRSAHVVLGLGRFLWVAVWPLLGLALMPLILRIVRRSVSPLDWVSFIALWLLAYVGGPVVLAQLFADRRPATFLTEYSRSVAPVVAVAALIGHATVAAVVGSREGRPQRCFALVVPGAAALLAATFANIYWLPAVFSKMSIVWTTLVFAAGAAIAAVLWRVDLRRLERLLDRLADGCLRSPGRAGLLLTAILAATPVLSGLLSPHQRGGANRERPNVILITVDTLRADHLGSYGYPLSTTPRLDRFAREAATFTNCISTASSTVPAVASLMTSQYPSRHSAGITNGKRAMLPDEPTLARVLSENGYLTAAFVSNYVLSRQLRLYGGFDVYDDTLISSELMRDIPERKAGVTNEYVMNWLSTVPAGNFFLWVHYQDPHGPYTSPELYSKRFSEAAYPSGPDTLPVVGNFDSGGIPEYQHVSDSTSPSDYRLRYDAEIAYVDECIGELLACIKQMGLWKRSIVVVSADHGEAMGEHGYYFCHGQNLAEELIHVPLIVHIPWAERPARIDELVSIIDIAPTIIAATGLNVELGNGGINLMPLIEGRTDRLARKYVVAEDAHGRKCFHARGTKYVAGSDTEQLYDLTLDPHESRNILDEDPKLATSWRAVRNSYRSKAKPRGNAAPAPRYDPRDAQKLKSLGYLN